MRQILTILWDSYKLLLARKLFWVALVISILLAIGYASVEIKPDGFSAFFGLWTVDFEGMFEMTQEKADRIYISIFSDYLMRFWLGGMAIALGLISVCSVFPEMMKTGAIDVVLSKPIGRVTLFFTKYIGSCMFVGAQVFIFCLVVFFAMGFRTGEWAIGIFSAVWLILFSFSLIYGASVLVAVWSKSTLLSLLMAFMVWGISWGVQATEGLIYRLTFTAAKIGLNFDESGKATTSGSSEEPDTSLVKAHDVIKKVGAFVPKTREITFLIKRKIIIQGKDLTIPSEDDALDIFAQADMEFENRHSQTYILGTSLIFQCVVLGLACWSFTRKEF